MVISRWFEYKETAIGLRKNGLSLKTIELSLGIPRSTLSYWFKDIELSETHKKQLLKNKEDGWAKARIKAAEWHRTQKALRLLEAKKEALETLNKLEISDATLDLALAMLYLGEGAKNGSTSISSSSPMILKFVIAVLQRNYKIPTDGFYFELHLRADQNPQDLKDYWSNELRIPIEQFRHVAIDKRSIGRPTYDHYKGVCVLRCGQIAIQRKLIYLYNIFCDKVSELELGV